MSDLLRFLDARSGCLTTQGTGAFLVSLKRRASPSKACFRIRAGRAHPDKKKVPSKTGQPHPGTPEEFQKPQPATEEVSLVRDQWLVSSQASLALPSEAQSDQIRETGLATEVSNDPPRKHTQIENL